MTEAKVDEKPLFWRWPVLVSIASLGFAALGGAWTGIQIYLRLREPAPDLVATVEVAPVLCPVDRSSGEDDIYAIARMKKQFAITITNTGGLKAENVRIFLPARATVAYIPSSGGDDHFVHGFDMFTYGTLDVSQSVRVYVWADTPLSDQDSVIVAHEKGRLPPIYARRAFLEAGYTYAVVVTTICGLVVLGALVAARAWYVRTLHTLFQDQRFIREMMRRIQDGESPAFAAGAAQQYIRDSDRQNT